MSLHYARFNRKYKKSHQVIETRVEKFQKPQQENLLKMTNHKKNPRITSNFPENIESLAKPVKRRYLSNSFIINDNICRQCKCTCNAPSKSL